jgi:hypothetical protein
MALEARDTTRKQREHPLLAQGRSDGLLVGRYGIRPYATIIVLVTRFGRYQPRRSEQITKPTGATYRAGARRFKRT